jgi:hypothetical protein
LISIAEQNKKHTNANNLKEPKNFSLTVNFKAAGLANIVTGAFLTSSGGRTELPMCQSWWQQQPTAKESRFCTTSRSD